ncbi:uncharacterized protein LOC133303199 [Gastrolobium bilobum]|uniref:uncharacterized protein LOC133303199 n=1 Tax=Gastrolobium bilobum TaxID=150636 RepID=UPI002AB1443D|nr:uncharacterized protein LOC133303199 [Gastrolobium bilobum]
MSWLARSIANSLRLDDVEEEQEEEEHVPNNNNNDLKSTPESKSDPVKPDPQSQSSSPTTARGVKEDISELTKTISRQFWGVASFLAPPPDPEPEPDPSRPQTQISNPDEALIAGIRSDFAEISGKFKSGISKLSGNKAVSEITKIASSFLQLGSEEERPLHEYEGLDGVVGITEEVMQFARNIAMHPETWLDFPLPYDPDSDDFELSDAQQEHALAVERLAPRLAALRLELCPGYMSDDCFWKIYFVLLHPRLSKNDADFLSTPQIMEARAMLTQTLDKRSKEKKEPDLSASANVQSKEADHHLSVPSSAQHGSDTLKTSVVEAVPSMVVPDVEMEKHTVQSTEIQIIDKSVVKEAPVNPTAEESSSSSANRVLDDTYEDDADDWLKEDTSEMVGGSGTSFPTANEDDVSFSDLEEDEGEVPASYKKATSGSDSSAKDSRDWVQLSRSSASSDKDINSVESKHAGSEHASARNSENKDSNDWLNVDDIDVM